MSVQEQPRSLRCALEQAEGDSQVDLVAQGPQQTFDAKRSEDVFHVLVTDHSNGTIYYPPALLKSK